MFLRKTWGDILYPHVITWGIHFLIPLGFTPLLSADVNVLHELIDISDGHQECGGLEVS